MCPVPTESRLIGYLPESTWTLKSKSNMLIPRTNLPTSSRKAILTCEEWNHFHRLFNVMDTSQFASSHFSSTSSAQTMSKRLIQQEIPGEDERVVAKSKPMWNLVSKTVDRYHLTARGHSKQKVYIWITSARKLVSIFPRHTTLQ